MTRWGMSIDMDMCTGCGSCLVACAQENNVPPGEPSEPDRLIRWLELLPIETGSYPHVEQEVMPMPCQHCERPPCVKVCPVDATYKNPEGLVPQIYPQCIGCRYCMNACPYSVKHFNWNDPKWPAPFEKGLNPDVSLRTRGVVEKCNFCMHRLQKARDAAAIDEKPFQAASYRTACQEVCPTKAIHLGDLDDPDSLLAENARGPRAKRLLEELGTEPKVVYLQRRS